MWEESGKRIEVTRSGFTGTATIKLRNPMDTIILSARVEGYVDLSSGAGGIASETIGRSTFEREVLRVGGMDWIVPGATIEREILGSVIPGEKKQSVLEKLGYTDAGLTVTRVTVLKLAPGAVMELLRDYVLLGEENEARAAADYVREACMLSGGVWRREWERVRPAIRDEEHDLLKGLLGK
jgi:hypothetical protein